MRCEVKKINSSTFVITTSEDIDLSIKCGKEIPHKTSIRGTYLVTMDVDCFITSDTYSIYRPKSPPGIEEESNLLQNPLDLSNWFNDAKEKMDQHLTLANDFMTNIGKPVKLKDIMELSHFQAQMEAVDKEEHWGSNWFSLPGILNNFFSTILSFGPVIVLCFIIYKCACCYLDRRRGGSGTGWYQFRRPRYQDGQEMHVLSQQQQQQQQQHPRAIPPEDVWRQARSVGEDTMSTNTQTTTA